MFYVICWNSKSYYDSATGNLFEPRLHISGREIAVLETTSEGSHPYIGQLGYSVLTQTEFFAVFPVQGE